MRHLLWAAAAVLLALPAQAASGGSFQLKIFEGYDFTAKRVVKSGSEADLSFTYQVRRSGMISYLGSAKIKDFEAPPRGVTAADVAGWKDYIAGPAPGYYVVKSRDGKHYYQLHLRSFENQGKAASYWLMTFDWEEIAVR